MGRSFRVFAHRRDALLGAAQSEGLGLVEGGRGRIWEFAALERSS
jgi:hypothetical protein